MKQLRILKKFNCPNVTCRVVNLPRNIRSLATAKARVKDLVNLDRFTLGIHLTDYIAYEIQVGCPKYHKGQVHMVWETLDYRHSYTGIGDLKILDIREFDPPTWPPEKPCTTRGL